MRQHRWGATDLDTSLSLPAFGVLRFSVQQFVIQPFAGLTRNL